MRVHFVERGKGPVLLWLHPFPLHGDSMRHQLEELSKSWRVVVPDQRGFGRSALPIDAGRAEITTMDDLADDAVGVLDALGVEQAVLGGVSMGGYALMALLRRAPERVRGVVLADTHAAADDDEGKKRREESARAVLENGASALEPSLLPRLLAPEAPRHLKDDVRRMLLGADPRALAAAQRGMALRPDSHETLAAWRGPALILVGDQDEITPSTRADAMAARMPQAKVVIVGGAGHLANLEAPAAFNVAVERFLGAL